MKMEKLQILLDYLKKHCEIPKKTPVTEDEQFSFYCSAVNKLPSAYVTDGFMKIEDAYLSEQIKKKDIFDANKATVPISVVKKSAAYFRADAALCFVTQENDKSVYLYGGTRLKTQVTKSLSKENITISKANNLFYKGVISARLPEISAKITSVILSETTEKYKYALDTAIGLNLESIVLCVPSVENKLIENRIASAIINEIKLHSAYEKVKIVLAVTTDDSLNIYQKLIKGGNL